MPSQICRHSKLRVLVLHDISSTKDA
ncbi:unnamed protein product, partial [Rotaria sp. Silwood1]